MDFNDFSSLSFEEPLPNTRNVEPLTPFDSPGPTSRGESERPFTPDSVHSSNNPAHLTPAHSVNGEPRSEYSSPASLDNFEDISPDHHKRMSPGLEQVDEPDMISPLMNGAIWNGASWVQPRQSFRAQSSDSVGLKDTIPMGEKPSSAMRGERLRSSHASMDNLTSEPIPSPLMNDSKWNGRTWVRPLNRQRSSSPTPQATRQSSIKSSFMNERRGQSESRPSHSRYQSMDSVHNSQSSQSTTSRFKKQVNEEKDRSNDVGMSKKSSVEGSSRKSTRPGSEFLEAVMNGTHIEVIHRNAAAIEAELKHEEEAKKKTRSPPYTSTSSSTSSPNNNLYMKHSSDQSSTTIHRRYASSLNSVLNSSKSSSLDRSQPSSSSATRKPTFAERREALRKFQNKSLDKESPQKSPRPHFEPKTPTSPPPDSPSRDDTSQRQRQASMGLFRRRRERQTRVERQTTEGLERAQSSPRDTTFSPKQPAFNDVPVHDGFDGDNDDGFVDRGQSSPRGDSWRSGEEGVGGRKYFLSSNLRGQSSPRESERIRTMNYGFSSPSRQKASSSFSLNNPDRTGQTPEVSSAFLSRRGESSPRPTSAQSNSFFDSSGEKLQSSSRRKNPTSPRETAVAPASFSSTSRGQSSSRVVVDDNITCNNEFSTSHASQPTTPPRRRTLASSPRYTNNGNFFSDDDRKDVRGQSSPRGDSWRTSSTNGVRGAGSTVQGSVERGASMNRVGFEESSSGLGGGVRGRSRGSIYRNRGEVHLPNHTTKGPPVFKEGDNVLVGDEKQRAVVVDPNYNGYLVKVQLQGVSGWRAIRTLIASDVVLEKEIKQRSASRNNVIGTNNTIKSTASRISTSPEKLNRFRNSRSLSPEKFVRQQRNRSFSPEKRSQQSQPKPDRVNYYDLFSHTKNDQQNDIVDNDKDVGIGVDNDNGEFRSQDGGDSYIDALMDNLDLHERFSDEGDEVDIAVAGGDRNYDLSHLENTTSPKLTKEALKEHTKEVRKNPHLYANVQEETWQQQWDPTKNAFYYTMLDKTTGQVLKAQWERPPPTANFIPATKGFGSPLSPSKANSSLLSSPLNKAHQSSALPTSPLSPNKTSSAFSLSSPIRATASSQSTPLTPQPPSPLYSKLSTSAISSHDTSNHSLPSSQPQQAARGSAVKPVQRQSRSSLLREKSRAQALAQAQVQAKPSSTQTAMSLDATTLSSFAAKTHFSNYPTTTAASSVASAVYAASSVGEGHEDANNPPQVGRSLGSQRRSQSQEEKDDSESKFISSRSKSDTMAAKQDVSKSNSEQEKLEHSSLGTNKSTIVGNGNVFVFSAPSPSQDPTAETSKLSNDVFVFSAPAVAAEPLTETNHSGNSQKNMPDEPTTHSKQTLELKLKEEEGISVSPTPMNMLIRKSASCSSEHDGDNSQLKGNTLSQLGRKIVSIPNRTRSGSVDVAGSDQNQPITAKDNTASDYKTDGSTLSSLSLGLPSSNHKPDLESTSVCKKDTSNHEELIKADNSSLVTQKAQGKIDQNSLISAENEEDSSSSSFKKRKRLKNAQGDDIVVSDDKIIIAVEKIV